MSISHRKGHIKLYYWNERPNLGDILSKLILERFTHLPSKHAKPSDSNLVIVGSILEHLPGDWKGVIAGAGKLHEWSRLDLRSAKKLAVRGPLTARALNANSGVVLGDPALLANELILPQDKKYKLGLVPHWTDDILETNKLFLQYDPIIIRIGHDPIKVITEIAQCDKIVSSSLHGIVLSDAFNIPRRVELAPSMTSPPFWGGSTFKWEDYHQSLNMKFEVGITKQADYNIVTEKQHELFDVFEEVKVLFSRQARY